jgi:hypothetical protein
MNNRLKNLVGWPTTALRNSPIDEFLRGLDGATLTVHTAIGHTSARRGA